MNKDEFTRNENEKSDEEEDKKSKNSSLDAFLEYGSDISDDEKKQKLEDNVNDLVNSDGESNLEKHDQVDHDTVLKKMQEIEDLVDNEAEDYTKEVRCHYCGIINTQLLIKCNEKDCQRWFCNGRTDDYSASHIVFHLTKSKHKEVYVTNSTQVGEMVLECYNCASKNIFLLGFLEAKDGESGFILCREPCLTTCKIEEDKFDKSNWVPLINDKKLLDWIIPLPDENELKLCHRVNIRTMSKMEDKWEKEKMKEFINSSGNERNKNLNINFLKGIKLFYKDGQDYVDIFEPLISGEEEYDRKLKESQKKHNIKVAFYRLSRRTISKFVYPREDNEIKLVPGDELKIIDNKTNITYNGFIIKMEMGINEF